MGTCIGLAFGVCSALLCHWMIRHTYVDWEWVELEQPEEEGSRRKKVWNRTLQLPRWVYILIWVSCILLSLVAVIVPIAVGLYLWMQSDIEGWKFIHNSKFLGWFTKKV